MSSADADGPVLVAVGDPEHAQQLVRTAGDVARLGRGTVRLVTVVVKPYDSPFGVFDDGTIVREYASEGRDLLRRVRSPAGVSVERDIVVARSVARGVLRAVDESDPSALVVGWEGQRRRSDAVLGTTVDRLVERAGCDLYVERVGYRANGVESVLLPVAGGPHVEAAATVAKAIAVRNAARVVVLSVGVPNGDVSSDSNGNVSSGSNGDANGGPVAGTTDRSGDGESRAAAGRFVAEGRAAVESAPGPSVPVETVVRESADVTEAVVDTATGHDVVVLGATRQGRLRRRLVGSVPRRVVARSDRTVILARDGGTVGGPLGRVGELLRR